MLCAENPEHGGESWLLDGYGAIGEGGAVIMPHLVIFLFSTQRLLMRANED
jgi:hypothetical protein